MSAVVLRELVAKLGLQVDETAFKKADQELAQVKHELEGIDKGLRDARGRFKAAGGAMGNDAAKLGNELKKNVGKDAGGGGGLGEQIGKYLGGAAIVAGIAHMVELASNTVEAGNVLGEVFGAQGKAEVEAWSETMGQSLGRSKYSLQANTAALGAMIGPMVGNAAQAQEMSTKFAGLAVDLASFFNASDDEALTALKSGISGESEPLKRFGIVMQDATLQEYAHANGIKKKLSAMNVAEKTELRYRFILANTTKAQGDAARTAGEFANASRALTDHIKDVGISIGLKLLPAGKQLVTWANKALSMFEELSKGTTIVEAALVTLGVIMLATFGPAIVAALGTAAAFAAIAIAVDDVITLFQGGDSIVGSFMDTLFGEGAAEAFVASISEAFDWLKTQYAAVVVALQQVDWSKKLSELQSNLRALGSVLKDVFEAAWPYIQKTLKAIGWMAEALGKIAAISFKSISELFEARSKAAYDPATSGGNNKSDLYLKHEARRLAREAAARDALTAPMSPPPTISAAPASVVTPGPRAAVGGGNTVINMGGATIVVPPGTTPDAAAKAAAKSAMLERRRLQYALSQSTTGRRTA